MPVQGVIGFPIVSSYYQHSFESPKSVKVRHVLQYQCHRPRMENSSIQTVELSRKEMLELEETYPCQNYHHLTTLYNWSAVKLILLGWEGGNGF